MKKAEECLILIQSLEFRIRKGDISSAQKDLQEINIKEIPRDHIVTLANLARRSGLNYKCLGFLNKIVRPENSLQSPATNKEKAEYAVALQRIGALKEAVKLLEGIDGEQLPEVLLYKSFCLFAQWNYAEAVPLLRNFVSSDSLTEYMKTVGQVNLAAALVIAKKNSEAKDLLQSLEAHAKEKELDFLLGNIMELSAQLCVNKKQFGDARKYLNHAFSRFQKFDSPDSLAVRKWMAIVECIEANAISESLFSVIEKAKSYGHWETLRHCDLIISSIQGDEAILKKVYFGTPYPDYRAKILEEIQNPWSLPDDYIYMGSFKNCERSFNLELGEEDQGANSLPTGQLIHQLVVLLCSDLYKPLSLGRLYSNLFDGEYFNPFTSPDRIYQLIKRLKKWLIKNQMPVEIQSSSSGYGLEIKQPYGFVIPKTPLPIDTTKLGIRKLFLKAGIEFSGKEAREKTGIPLSSMNRLLKAGLEENLLEKIGSGPRTRYKIKQK